MENTQDEKVIPGDPDNVKSDVAKQEEATLAFWQENKIFEKTLEQTKDGSPFVFYDGPPFATGLPHYGHLLAGTIKDMIPRYQTMKGRYVARRWGWDCHGLPLENLIEAELGLKTKKDIENLGIGKFNEAAREAVLRYADDWRKIVPRFGRFVDMENDYRTMDSSYSESVWWVFKTLFDKGLIYEGYKSMHLCPRCETTLSNFEVNQGYKDITDISVTVEFELIDRPNVFILAWTTTPWTLPGNVALAINPDIEYVEVRGEVEGNLYIVARERVGNVFGETYEIIRTIPAKDLIGKKYKPVFDYYAKDADLKNKENGWQIYGADFVTTESGTGVVHIAPAFGDDDMELGQKENLPFVQHVATDGKFKPEVKDFAGQQVKPKDDHQKADIEVIKNLAHRDLLFKKEKIVHSYPHCWRCDTPLLNYASSSWFVKVTDLKDKLVEANKKITWVPEHIKEGRFGKWLEGARDWAISRSRFWGAPLPVWRCSGCEEIKVVGSRDDLLGNTSKKVTKVIFLRHGESEKNVKNIWSSAVNKYPLTEVGVKQAEKMAKELNRQEVVAIYTSPVLRAKQTANIIGSSLGLSVSEDDGLMETREGEWEDKTISQINELDSRNKYLLIDDIDERYNAKRGKLGESWAEVERRFYGSVKKLALKHVGKTIVVVTHQGPLAYGLRAFNDFLLSDMPRLFSEISYAQPHEVYFDIDREKELDLHRPFIDEVKFDCKCGGKMARVPDVFDCWFESGSMPYGQKHYLGQALTLPAGGFDPTKNVGFPAEFIAEGLDQTRGWFYSLIVLGVALFDKSPYKNVIVNGLVLAEDGQKMSKSLKNYPDPIELVNKYGADAVRYYMVSSPIVRGEDLSFSEKGVDEVYKKIILRLQNVVALYQMYADENVEAKNDSKNVLDQWMISRLNQVVGEVTEGLDNYELDKAVRPFDLFVDDLSTWYVRRSRERFKGEDLVDKNDALSTTKYVLLELAKLLAPIMPFLAERIYGDLGGEKESVHLETWAASTKVSASQASIVTEMQKVREVVSLGLEARAKAKIKVRQPLALLKIKDVLADEYLSLIEEEVNVKKVELAVDLADGVSLDTNITEELAEEGEMRDLLREVQSVRKTHDLNPSDRVRLTLGEKHHALATKFKDEFLRVAGVVEIALDGSVDLRIEKIN